MTTEYTWLPVPEAAPRRADVAFVVGVQDVVFDERYPNCRCAVQRVCPCPTTGSPLSCIETACRHWRGRCTFVPVPRRPLTHKSRIRLARQIRRRKHGWR